MPQHSSLVQHEGVRSREALSNRSNSGIQKQIRFTNTPTTVTHSRQLSQPSNQKSKLVQAQRRLEYCPPSPNHIQRIEPIRRISQHRVNISQTSEERSNGSLSQQNINIVIETQTKGTGQPPPKITVSHIQKEASQNKKSSLVMRTPGIVRQPSAISHISNQTLLERSRQLRPLTENNSPAKPVVRFVT